MMLPGAPFPPNEHERLAALHALHILDTPAEECFDRITRLARQIFQVPIALITLVDKRRQWFKSCFGLSASETPRGQSFCAYTLLDNCPLVVPDALADPRFAENPLVAGDPYIRFYAGYPFQTSKGYTLGTLCIIDHVLRQFDSHQLALLHDLTRFVEREIDLINTQMTSWQHNDALSEITHLAGLDAPNYSQNNQLYFFPIFEHVAIGIAYLQLDGQWLEMNESLCHITGYGRDELRQMTFQELTYPEDLKAIIAHHRRLLDNDIQTYSLEKRYIRKDRTLVWINLTVSMLRDTHQQPLFMIATIEDISAHKYIEEERRDLLAREATARIQSERIKEQLLVLQAITDTALEHLHLDALFQAILGKIRQIMFADNIAILLLNEQEQCLTVKAVLGIKEAIASDIRIPLGGGFAGKIAAECIPLIVNNQSTVEILSPMLHEDIRALLGVPLIVNERVIGVMHIGMKRPRVFTEQDVNLLQRVANRMALAIERSLLYEEAQRVSQELQQRSQMLQEMNTHQSNFISIVSHEFRTTLTGIRGFSEILLNENFTPEEVQEYASDIHEDSLRLIRMTNDLLDIEKMREGQAQLHLELFNIAEVFQEQIERGKVSTKQHTFHLIIDEDLPDIEADKDKISQVVANLLSNAIKYSPQGGQIILRCQKETATLHLQIEDQGIGIPKKSLKKVFDTYSRVYSDSTRYIQGSGLGLSIVQQIVQMHGGSVWADSVQGEGATFHVVLSLKHDPARSVIFPYTLTTTTNIDA